MMLARQPGGADHLARTALQAASIAETLSHRLWCWALLGSHYVRPERVTEIAEGRRALLSEVARERPHDFVVSAALVLEEGPVSARGPLTGEHLRRLENACSLPGPDLELSGLFDTVVRERQAVSAPELSGCLIDALSLLPDPLLQLLGRHEATIESKACDRERLGRLFRSVGARFAEDRTLVTRLVAHELLRRGAELMGDLDAANDVTASLTFIRARYAPEQLLPLDWPIEPLRRELVVASAHDEWALTLRRSAVHASA